MESKWIHHASVIILTFFDIKIHPRNDAITIHVEQRLCVMQEKVYNNLNFIFGNEIVFAK